MAMFFVLIVTTVTVVLASSSSNCPCWPLDGKNYDIVCDDRSLKSIPDCIPSNVTILSINTPSIPLVADTFKRFTNLPQLNIQSFKRPKISKDMFKYLANLKTLNISNTRIGYINKDWFMYTPSLTKIELGKNKLTWLDKDTFSYLPTLEKVNLYKNRFFTLSPQLFNGTSLKKLYLGGNPFRCYCEMEKFMQWTRDNGVNVADQPLCEHPQKLKGFALKDLKPSYSCTG